MAGVWRKLPSVVQLLKCFDDCENLDNQGIPSYTWEHVFIKN